MLKDDVGCVGWFGGGGGEGGAEGLGCPRCVDVLLLFRGRSSFFPRWLPRLFITRRREDEDVDEAPRCGGRGGGRGSEGLMKGADATYGSRGDCTQLFRRAILMPWTPLVP